MSALDRKLAQLTAYGFYEDGFPAKVNGHSIRLVQNEGYEKEESDHIAIDYGLWCENCQEEYHIDGLVPEDDVVHVIPLIQLYAFHTYVEESCDRNI